MSQYNPVSDELIKELKNAVGAENVKTDPDTMKKRTPASCICRRLLYGRTAQKRWRRS